MRKLLACGAGTTEDEPLLPHTRVVAFVKSVAAWSSTGVEPSCNEREVGGEDAREVEGLHAETATTKEDMP